MSDSRQHPPPAPPSESVRMSKGHTNADSAPAYQSTVQSAKGPARDKQAVRRAQRAADRALQAQLLEQHHTRFPGTRAQKGKP